MKKTTREWVKKAEADYTAAQKLSRATSALPDQVCFLCQQCAEKYLKALLEELGEAIPYTHILADLVALLLPHHKNLHSISRGMRFLTRFAVAFRYPGESATNRQAKSAMRWAERVREAARSILGIRPQKRKRK